MGLKRKFYPLRPSLGRRSRRPRNVSYAYVSVNSIGEFDGGVALVGNNVIYMETIEQVAGYILSLPHASWIITWEAQNWYSCLSGIIGSFDEITGIHESRVITIRCGDTRWNIIDAFQFYQEPLIKAISKISPSRKIDKTNRLSMLIATIELWNNLESNLDKFGVYPSKTPGNTALKLFTRFLRIPIRTRGMPVLRLTRQAQRAPAMFWKVGYYKQAYMYDINACYVHVMRILRYPVIVHAFVDEPPPTDRWIARVIIDYELDDNRLFSPLSVRLSDEDISVSPRSSKNLTTVITYIDAVSLSMHGRLRIKKWIEGVYWYPEDEYSIFTEWADAIEEQSLQSTQSYYALKVVSRALHSKFSPRPFVEIYKLLRVDDDDYERLLKTANVQQDYILPDGSIAVLTKKRKHKGFVPYERPDWEALTLSMAHYMIYSSVDEHTIYVNTDCLISTERRNDLEISTKFGAWKLKEYGECYISGLGNYVIGSEVAQSGMKTSKRNARTAIIRAATGMEYTIKIINSPGIITGYSTRTVSASEYPRARTIGTTAYVSRSPETIHKIKVPRAAMATGTYRKIKHVE